MSQKGGPFLNMIGTQQEQIINKQKTNTTSTKIKKLVFSICFYVTLSVKSNPAEWVFNNWNQELDASTRIKEVTFLRKLILILIMKMLMKIMVVNWFMAWLNDKRSRALLPTRTVAWDSEYTILKRYRV